MVTAAGPADPGARATPDGNDPAFDPVRAARGGHVESYFIKLNSPDGARAVWLRWTVFADVRRAPRAECWAVAFARGSVPRAIKRSGDLDPGAIARVPFAVRFGPAEFDGARARGELAGPRGKIAWDLVLAPRVAPLRQYARDWMYRGPFPESKLTSPLPDAAVSGWVEVDGQRTDVTGWRAMQGHNWGRRHTQRYAWCHAGGFDDAEGVVFEGFSARLARAGIELPWATMAFLWLDGAWVRFDQPRVVLASRAEASVMRWWFKTGPSAEGYRLEGEARAVPREAAGLHYLNPGGAAVTYCLNSKLAALTLRVERPAGGTLVLKTNRAALELGWPSADHGVEMLA